MRTTRVIAAIFLAGMMLFLHYFVITQLLKSKADLTDINGTIKKCYLTVKDGKHGYKAIILVLEDSPILFAVDESKQRAFNYLSNHDVIGHPAEILYDPEGYFYPNNMTFYLDGVAVDDNILLTMAEAKFIFKIAGVVVILLDLLMIGLYYRAKKLNKPFWR
jgi:hypothetical protein